MIFSEGNHVEMVIDGRKTQTRRSSDRYQVGKTYAVQACRTCKGVHDGRILIIRKWKEENPYEPWKHVWPPIISWEDAQAEGGYGPDNYEGLYEKMHPNWKERWCYEFEFWFTSDFESLEKASEEAKHQPSTIYSQQLGTARSKGLRTEK